MSAFTSEGSATRRRRGIAWAGVVLVLVVAPVAGRADEAAARARLKKLGCSIQTEGPHPGAVWYVEVDSTLARKAKEADLKLLKEFPKLRYLTVGLPVSDAILKDIGEIPSLQRLSVSSNRITDLGLWHLRNLTHLRELYLGSPRITDAGLKYLKGLTELRILNLNHSRVTDAGMLELRQIPSLCSVGLRSTRVGDAGIRALADLPKLEVLSLESTRVTDAGMRALRGCKKLRSVSVYYTRVTDAGANDLKSAIPNLGVSKQPDKGREPKNPLLRRTRS